MRQYYPFAEMGSALLCLVTPDCEYHLWHGSLIPSDDFDWTFTAGIFEEVSYPAYAPVTVDDSAWDIEQGANFVSLVAPEITFAAVNSAGPKIANGYWIVDGRGGKMALARFDAPQFRQPGELFTVLPVIVMNDGGSIPDA